MGEYAEERAVMMGLDEVYEDLDFKYWTMKDGTQIKISNMSDTHLENAIKMLKRNNKYLTVSGYAKYKALKREQEKRSNIKLNF